MRLALSLLFTVAALSGMSAAQVAAPLRPFVSCHFSDGLSVIEKQPTPPAALGRTALTLLGPKQVPITRGEKLLLAYPGKDPFARMTVEQLSARSFLQGKADLISAFDKIIASDANVERNYMLKPQINGFEANGLDRKQAGGVVMGIYVLVDDPTRTVVSIDFLNQPTEGRSFGSLHEYSLMRDSFLASYTSCARANLHAASVTPVAKPAAAPPTKKVFAKK